jgi:hypothetical protein
MNLVEVELFSFEFFVEIRRVLIDNEVDWILGYVWPISLFIICTRLLPWNLIHSFYYSRVILYNYAIFSKNIIDRYDAHVLIVLFYHVNYQVKLIIFLHDMFI